MTQEDKSKARDLKPEQQSAAHTLDRHVSVIAGPGSGKTTVLVERYLNILRHKGASADQIVAITFTNRAANEMRTRLRREVDRILASADQGERRKWLRHKRTLEGAMITTIHGFCSRLLREFPLEAEIDPQFILLDEYQSALLEQTVIDEVVSAEIEGGSDAIAQLALFAGRPALSLMVSKTYGTVRNQGIDLDQSEQETEQYHAKADEYAECVAKLERQMDEFLNAKGLSAGAEAKRCEAAARWPGFRKLIQNPPQLRDAARFCAMLEEFRSHTRPSSSPKVKALVEALDALIWAKDLKGELPLVAFDLFARDYALSLLSLVRKVDERLIQEKQRMSALGYDDLQLLALNLLRSREAVRRRVAARYRFYLIDEFQDTNGLQQEMVNLLALDPRHRANLFIVGDPKQSIYGFRGADVHVFSTVSAQIDSTGGALIPLHANFRSRPQLIHFFNELFRKTFHDCGLSSEELDELGFVPHEDGVAEREDGENIAPLVELHVCEYPKKGNEFSDSDEAVPRELDAAQVAARISDLVAAAGDADGAPSGFRYKEIAVLFRAMTSVGIYESALRRAGIPYRTVAGSGFYQREEVGDLIQLLCFVDNLTDELALASVLRSPLCCVSDNALMALRCGPALSDGQDWGRGFDDVRPLYPALLDFESTEVLDDDDCAALSDARSLISALVEARHRLSVPDLLRLAVERASYLQVIAASFDGALRVANVEKLIGLAERFSASGPYTVRDFVRFVRDFEKRGGRESEGSLDETLDAVTLMTIHQSKGLEFPVVILPDLHRVMKSNNDRFVIDRHRGISLCVPDGKGDWLLGSAFSRLKERAASRDRFESMRLLYVAATRAQEMLILSGATSEREKLVGADSSWLGWIYSFVAESHQSVEDSTYNINGVKVRFDLRLPGSINGAASAARANGFNQSDLEEQLTKPFESSFPLLKPLSDSGPARAETYSVTKLSQFEQCPRHYYFKHISGLADSYAEIDQLSDDLPFGPSALLKGWVLHRFCETYRADLKVEDCLRTSIDSILKEKQYDPELLAQRIDHERLFKVLTRFAVTYSKSSVVARIEEAGKRFAGESGLSSCASYGVFSERRFTLRHGNALVMGTIDKMIVTPDESGEGSKIEIIDFKTNRIPKVVADPHGDGRSFTNGNNQFQTAIAHIAYMYRLQMQAYAFAVRSVLPSATEVKATLHFLDDDVEYAIEAGYLTVEASKAAVDGVLGRMSRSRKLEDFAPRTGEHCRRCGFLDLCASGSAALTGLVDDSSLN